jgi:hypothetical protein
MTLALDPSVRELSCCGCCEGTGTVTPAVVANRPGLPAIAYRVGTHGAFKRSLIAGLSDARRPALAGLRTREDDDFAIALLDCVAVVGDVLTFYQERIANESYLRTATERWSVLELARLIGYELGPGVAADTLLAYTLEDAPGAPAVAAIDAGARVQSVPKPGERPQAFETIEPLDARATWNALRPRRRALRLPQAGDRELLLEGVATGLSPGDGVLIVGDERRKDADSGRWHFRIADTVQPDPAADLTRVTWAAGLGEDPADHDATPAAAHPGVYALRVRSALFGAAAPDWRTLPDRVRNRYLNAVGEGDPSASDTAAEWPGLTLTASSFDTTRSDTTTGVDADAIAGHGLLGEYFNDMDLSEPAVARVDTKVDFAWSATASPHPAVDVGTFSARWTGRVIAAATATYTFTTRSDDGVRLWIDGNKIIDNWTHHAPHDDTGTAVLQHGRPTDLRLEFFQDGGPATIQLSWESASQAKEVIPPSALRVPDVIQLGTFHPEIAPGGWLVLTSPAATELYTVAEAAESSRQGFAIAGKTTRVALDGPRLDRFARQVRQTAVHAADEPLPVGSEPITDPVEGDVVDLDAIIEAPPVGRTLVVSGRRVRVEVTAGAALALIPDDGGAQRPLPEGEQLVLLARPPTGQTVWGVRDAAGVKGTVDAPTGRLVVVPAADGDPEVAEAATLASAEAMDAIFTRLTLEEPLDAVLDRATVTIAANVAAATQGESTSETLGSGDAARAFQRFALRDKPLTYVHADTPAGALSTLELRVNGLLWHEVPSLFGHGPRERVYVSRRADDGSTSITFGDGATGARPPTGQQNVIASYRKGIGRDGDVDAGQLSLLMTRPLGVRSVTNPLRALGGQDPQVLADARENAPVTVLTLGRVVSLRDYEDFARDFAGIAKAAAVWTWHEDGRGVLLTVAGPDGEAVPDDGTVANGLRAAIAGSGDARVPLDVGSYRPLGFRIGATLEVDPDAVPATVLAAAEDVLRAAFSFAARAFGQPVALSEVVAVIQSVAGVISGDVHSLYTGTAAGRTALLIAEAPAPGADAATAQPAQLLTIDLRRGDLQVAP